MINWCELVAFGSMPHFGVRVIELLMGDRHTENWSEVHILQLNVSGVIFTLYITTTRETICQSALQCSLPLIMCVQAYILLCRVTVILAT